MGGYGNALACAVAIIELMYGGIMTRNSCKMVIKNEEFWLVFLNLALGAVLITLIWGVGM
jgi:hypothetical protein